MTPGECGGGRIGGGIRKVPWGPRGFPCDSWGQPGAPGGPLGFAWCHRGRTPPITAELKAETPHPTSKSRYVCRVSTLSASKSKILSFAQVNMQAQLLVLALVITRSCCLTHQPHAPLPQLLSSAPLGPGSFGSAEDRSGLNSPSRRNSIKEGAHAAFDHISAIQRIASDKMANSKVCDARRLTFLPIDLFG